MPCRLCVLRISKIERRSRGSINDLGYLWGRYIKNEDFKAFIISVLDLLLVVPLAKVGELPMTSSSPSDSSKSCSPS
jgi:hypothetical protein